MKNIKKLILESDYPKFYQEVWLEVLKISPGTVKTYSEIAKGIGRPKAQRAVGTALNKNPFAPVVPCHRVIRKNGNLGGYSKGVKTKILLLKKEMSGMFRSMPDFKK
ncbi:MAG: Methylated-DNA--protein-cysteine methyltransferase [Elusimicrobia bacterium ADurb.Bin231]|nr:MAG: Methylated-DNA--protein-cysteine methyltransferase [Elusimicrobia bacterium ADurb.Bin231]